MGTSCAEKIPCIIYSHVNINESPPPPTAPLNCHEPSSFSSSGLATDGYLWWWGGGGRGQRGRAACHSFGPDVSGILAHPVHP